MTRKFYKNVIILTVLSEDNSIEILSIDEIPALLQRDDVSLDVEAQDPILMTPREAASALRQQDSDPGFFGLDDEGHDV